MRIKPFPTYKSARRSSVFLHNTRCAGRSVSVVFAKYDNLHVTYGGGYLFTHVPNGSHFRYGIFENGCTLSDAGDFRWTIVRNPFDRLVSTWAAFRERRQGLSLDDVIQIAKLPGVMVDHDESSDHEIWTHTLPLVATPYESLDYIGRYENLLGTWKTFCEAVGVDEPLVHIGDTKKEDYRSAFTDTQRQEVQRLYARDLMQFQYSF